MTNGMSQETKRKELKEYMPTAGAILTVIAILGLLLAIVLLLKLI